MTDKTDEAVAWIIRTATGNVRLWTQDRKAAQDHCDVWSVEPECLFPSSSLSSRDARIAELEAALKVCRQTINEQASARLDPTMPLIAPDLVEQIRDEAEAQWACADNGDEGKNDRRAAHALSLLCDWQDRARATLTAIKGGE